MSAKSFRIIFLLGTIFGTVSFSATAALTDIDPATPPPIATTNISATSSNSILSSTSLTIYSASPSGQSYQNLYRIDDPTALSGYGIVRQIRKIDLKQGNNGVTFNDVARYIDPTTLTFQSLTDPTGTVLNEFNFSYDVVSQSKLIQQYLGQVITVEQNNADKIEAFTGKLLGKEGGLILQDNNGDILNLNNYSTIRFPQQTKANPSNANQAISQQSTGYITTPTLFMNIFANKSGTQQIVTSYQTQGITWWVTYNALYTETQNNTGRLDLGAWVNIINKSGIGYQNANIKLMAGELNQANPYAAAPVMAFKMAGNAAMSAGSGFSEAPFFEYHLYTLGRQVDVPNNSIKQIELFPKKSNIPVDIIYVYSNADNAPVYYGQPYINRDPGYQSSSSVDTYLKFTNGKKQGLGSPLPAGRIRINKTIATNNKNDIDTSGEEFIGETNISHTPIDQELKLKVGTAFDIVAERKQVSFTVDETRHTMAESFEITLKNRKETDVVVTVREALYRTINWKIDNSSVDYNKINANTVEFALPVKKGSENTLKYTVRYTW